ncbi:MAG: hypothetical protein LBS43_11555 [Prevotellaceae bacterium]|nr:hypothetical protein [Prevotellaceae bacterium]
MKQILIIIACLMIVNMSEGQERNKYFSLRESAIHEFSVYGMGGLSSLNYTLSSGGSQSNGFGGSGGIGYTFNISDSWGVTTGAEIGIFGSKIAYGSLNDSYEGYADDYFSLTYSMNNYEEQHKVTLFSVPLMAQFKRPLGGGFTHFYFAGGFKIGLPVTAKATIAPRTISASGYFHYEEVEYVDLDEYGLANNLQLPKTTADVDLSFSAAAIVETGVRFSLRDNIALYAGAFLDYGLNSISSINDQPLVSYYQTYTSSTFGHNSILSTHHADASIFSAGLKIRLSFGK